jgi:hypothetical protein
VIVLRPTLKLAKQLKLGPLPDAAEATNTHCDWCVRPFGVGRIQYVIFTNKASLFSFVTRKKGVTNAKTLFGAFQTVLEDYLRATERGGIFKQMIAPAIGECSFARCRDRSIVGSMNDLVFQARWLIEPADLHPFDVFDHLNSAPMGALGMDNPGIVFAFMPAKPPSRRA